MSKARSPSYPSVSLKEAVERATMIWKKDYQNPIPRRVAAEHMGYQSLNGKSLGVLSALLKFGLLEGRGDETRISDLALQIIAHPSGSPERTAALKEASALPELFAEIDGRFNEGKASDQAIRSYLLTQRFIPAGAEAAIRAYRETKQFVSAESGAYAGERPPEESPTMQEHKPASAPPRQGIAQMFAPPREEVLNPEPGTKLVIGDDFVTVRAMLTSQQDVRKLVAKLIAIETLLPDATMPVAAQDDDQD